MSKRFFMRGGGGTFIINLSNNEVTINSGLQNASGESITVNIPRNSFHATIPKGDNSNYKMKINGEELQFSVGKITAEKDNESKNYTKDKLKNGDFPNSDGAKLNKV
jgi:hypothetical protein